MLCCNWEHELATVTTIHVVQRRHFIKISLNFWCKRFIISRIYCRNVCLLLIAVSRSWTNGCIDVVLTYMQSVYEISPVLWRRSLYMVAKYKRSHTWPLILQQQLLLSEYIFVSYKVALFTLLTCELKSCVYSAWSLILIIYLSE